jgi:hypothetical protein
MTNQDLEVLSNGFKEISNGIKDICNEINTDTIKKILTRKHGPETAELILKNFNPKPNTTENLRTLAQNLQSGEEKMASSKEEVTQPDMTKKGEAAWEWEDLDQFATRVWDAVKSVLLGVFIGFVLFFCSVGASIILSYLKFLSYLQMLEKHRVETEEYLG